MSLRKSDNNNNNLDFSEEELAFGRSNRCPADLRLKGVAPKVGEEIGYFRKLEMRARAETGARLAMNAREETLGQSLEAGALKLQLDRKQREIETLERSVADLERKNMLNTARPALAVHSSD